MIILVCMRVCLYCVTKVLNSYSLLSCDVVVIILKFKDARLNVLIVLVHIGRAESHEIVSRGIILLCL